MHIHISVKNCPQQKEERFYLFCIIFPAKQSRSQACLVWAVKSYISASREPLWMPLATSSLSFFTSLPPPLITSLPNQSLSFLPFSYFPWISTFLSLPPLWGSSQKDAHTEGQFHIFFFMNTNTRRFWLYNEKDNDAAQFYGCGPFILNTYRGLRHNRQIYGAQVEGWSIPRRACLYIENRV